MTWVYTPAAGILGATAFISICVVFLLSRRQGKAGVFPLILLMCAVAEWALTSGLEAASVGLTQKIFWSKIEYIGALAAPTLFLFFAIDFCQQTRWLTWRNFILFSVFPLAAWVVSLTNEKTHLIWKNFTPIPTTPATFIYVHGIGFYAIVAYDYFLVFAGILILISTWIRSSQPYRRQVGIILIGSVFPLTAGIIYSVGLIRGFDIAPVSFLATGMILAAGIYLYQLFDLAPIARDSLIENMLDGVLVLDTRNRIADLNPVAEKLIDSLSKNLIGKPVETALAFWPDLMARFSGLKEVRTEVLLQQDPARYLDLHISTLYDHRKQLTGKLLVFHDVTKRRQTEAELARNIEELKIINRISLVITSGLDMDRILKALHEQCAQVAAIDIFYVALYNPDSSLVNIPIYYQSGHYHAGPSRDIHDRPGLIGNVIQARQTLYLHDDIKLVTRPLVTPAMIDEKPPKSYIGIPLTVRDRVIGVMSIQSHKPNAYSEDQVRLLERIAVQAAIAIENARLYAEEQRLAIIDELTGIYNYRGLLELGAREVERSRRFDHPLAALFFDIDDFRIFNNTYSHATGNIVLQTLVHRCQEFLRSVDILARYGGDEFVALLPETDLSSAETVARRLVEEVSKTPIGSSPDDLRITISVGVAMLTKETPDLAALIDRANHAEREAKQGQKGIVAVAR
jgi:diguanylate cyclase (GGDEF)-like protein/PAS domain S-box-containing protein